MGKILRSVMREKNFKYKVSIDTLKICYLQSDGLWQMFKDIDWQYYNNNGLYEMDCFKVYMLSNKSKTMSLNIIVNDGEEDIEIGTLLLTNDEDYECEKGRYCFFTFKNSALYHIMQRDLYGNPVNAIICFDYIADVLGLKFNSISQIDVACDVNLSLVSYYEKYKKDTNNHNMIVNGRNITDSEKIKEHVLVFGCTRKRKEHIPSMYQNHKKGTGLRLKIYNKKRELIESSPEKQKEYYKWIGFSGKSLYRAEMTIKNEYFKEFLAFKNISLEERESILPVLIDEKFLLELFIHYIDRVIHFTNKKTRKHVGFAEIIENELI